MMGKDGMMCGGDMKQMMSMMQDMTTMMSAHTGMISARTEERIAALKSQLKVTDAQEPQWNRFAEALRGLSKSMSDVNQQHTMEPGAAAALPARLARREKTLMAQLDRVKSLEEALQPLYSSLSDEQKKVADGIKLGPMGMM